LDNLGSIVGVKAETLAVRKASKSGRPVDVYAYQHVDGAAVYEACVAVMEETALENVRISRALIAENAGVEPVEESREGAARH
jgi:pyruvate dehydrogenase E1 component